MAINSPDKIIAPKRSKKNSKKDVRGGQRVTGEVAKKVKVTERGIKKPEEMWKRPELIHHLHLQMSRDDDARGSQP